MNDAFNQEVQADFSRVYRGNQNFYVIKIIDMGTNYGERALVQIGLQRSRCDYCNRKGCINMVLQRRSAPIQNSIAVFSTNFDRAQHEA